MKISLESIDLAAGKFTTEEYIREFSKNHPPEKNCEATTLLLKELVTMLTFHLDYENDEIAIIPMIFCCRYTSDDRNQR
jgi:hypothetical protein